MNCWICQQATCGGSGSSTYRATVVCGYCRNKLEKEAKRNDDVEKALLYFERIHFERKAIDVTLEIKRVLLE